MAHRGRIIKEICTARLQTSNHLLLLPNNLNSFQQVHSNIDRRKVDRFTIQM